MSSKGRVVYQQDKGGGTKTSKGFPLMKLPTEIRWRIFGMHLTLNRPVLMKSTQNGAFSDAVTLHMAKCIHGIHTTVVRPDDDAPKSKYLRTHHYCTDPFTRVTTRIIVERSVLTLLLASKQIYAEACRIFYRTNEFHFQDVHSLAIAVRSMGVRRARAIEHVCFRFTSTSTHLAFKDSSYYVKNLKRLDLLLDFDSRLIHLNKESTLKTARGMKGLTQCWDRSLRVLNLVGRDLVERVDANGTKALVVVSVDEEDAVGPWLRGHMLSDDGKRLFARQQAIKKAQQAKAEAEKVEKAKQAEMAEKAKEAEKIKTA